MPGPNDFLTLLRPDRLAMMQPQAPGPSGITKFLSSPGVGQGLMSAGLRLLASDKRRETFGQALYDAVPQGLAAYEDAKGDAEYNTLLNDPSIPEQTRAMFKALGRQQGLPILASAMMRPPETTVIPEGGALAINGEIVAENEAPEEFTRQTLADGTIGVFDSQQNLIRTEGPAEDTSAEDEERTFNRTDRLADDFYRESLTAREIAQAVRRAQAADDSAVGDQTRIIALNKLLDPGSIVRGEEFDRVGQAGGLAGRAQWWYGQLKDGRLPDPLRRQLEAEVAAQFETAREAFAPTLERFRYRARANRVDEKQVVEDPFDGIAIATPTPTTNFYERYPYLRPPGGQRRGP